MSKHPDLSKDELLIIVKEHAVRNYEKDGWDFLIETCTDEDIVEAMGRSKKAAGAIWAVQYNLGLKQMAEQRQSVMNEAF